MNLLLTSVGHRSYLLDYFRGGLLPGDQLLAADASPYASGLVSADRGFVIPRANDPTYEPQLLRLCEREGVDAILTINDLELPHLATARAQLAQLGTRAIVSSPEVVETCFDKYATAQFLESTGFACPKTYMPSEVPALLKEIQSGTFGFPVIAKPRRGSRSQGIYLVHDATSLEKDAVRVGEVESVDSNRTIYQEFVESDQYSLHIFNDFSGRPVSVVGMVNLVSHVNGESFQIVTDDEPRLLELGWQLGTALGHVGPACVDVHKRGDHCMWCWRSTHDLVAGIQRDISLGRTSPGWF